MRQLDPYVASESERLAARNSLKRQIATVTVQRLRLAELQATIRKLDADSDAAANEHSEAAGRIQRELDTLDKQQIESVLAGEATPTADLQRRRELLNNLIELNRTLETRCSANQRAAAGLRDEIYTLSVSTAGHQQLEHRLIDLCSAATRRKILVCQAKLEAFDAAVKAVSESVETVNRNVAIHKRNNDNIEVYAATVRLDDMQAVQAALTAEAAELQAELTRLRSQALAE